MSPPNDSTNAAPRGALVFVFDQNMERVPLMLSVPNVMVGNYQFTPAFLNSAFTGRWTDERTLIFQPGSAIALGSTVTWTLNPEGAALPIKSIAGQLLPTMTGTYKIASNSGGNPIEICPPPAASYTFTKLLQYYQPGADSVLPQPNTSALLSVSVVSPSPAPSLTGGSITLPDNSIKTLNNQAGAYRRTETFANEAAIDVAYPSGAYTLRFNRTGEPEHVIPLSLPPSPTIVPKIENILEAQAIDPTKDFTLRWNSFSPQGADALVRIVINDEFGNRIFAAPNMCVPRTLDRSATSVTIPANYLRPGFQYTGQLVFGLNFYNSTTDVPQMSGNGFVQRILSFSLRASPGATGPLSEECFLGSGLPTGAYLIAKSFSNTQTSTGEVVPALETPANFQVLVSSPVGGAAVTNCSLTLPDGSTSEVVTQSGYASLYQTFETEAVRDAAYPPGDYTLRFTQNEQPERVIPMQVPVITIPPPRIVNYAAAQEIDATREFTLQWNSFSPLPPNASIQMHIRDQYSNLIFIAPNLCIPRSLEASATSIVIPTNYFRAGTVYHGFITFSANFYNSFTEVHDMAGIGTISQSTSFDLKAKEGGGTVPAVAGTFTTFRLLSNGHPQFNISGTADRNYIIERTSNLTTRSWIQVGTVTMNSAGSALFEDSSPTSFPAFYRAVGN